MLQKTNVLRGAKKTQLIRGMRAPHRQQPRVFAADPQPAVVVGWRRQSLHAAAAAGIVAAVATAAGYPEQPASVAAAVGTGAAAAGTPVAEAGAGPGVAGVAQGAVAAMPAAAGAAARTAVVVAVAGIADIAGSVATVAGIVAAGVGLPAAAAPAGEPSSRVAGSRPLPPGIPAPKCASDACLSHHVECQSRSFSKGFMLCLVLVAIRSRHSKNESQQMLRKDGQSAELETFWDSNLLVPDCNLTSVSGSPV